MKLLNFADIPAVGNPIGLVPIVEPGGDRGLVFGRASSNGVPLGKIPGYWTCPYNGRITHVYLTTNQGGFKVRVWSTFLPSAPIPGNAINLNGLTIFPPETHIEIFDLEDFSETDVIAGTTFAVEILEVYPPTPTDIAGSVVISEGELSKLPGTIPTVSLQPEYWYPIVVGTAQAVTSTSVVASGQSVKVSKGHSGGLSIGGTLWATIDKGQGQVQVTGSGPISVIYPGGGPPFPLPPQDWRVTANGPWTLAVDPTQPGATGASFYASSAGFWVPLIQGPEQILVEGSGPITIPGKVAVPQRWRIIANGPWVMATH